MDRLMIEQMLGIERPPYAWRVDEWLEADGVQIEPIGTVKEGPGNVSDDLLERVRSGEGQRFRMLDDDGFAYCMGRLLIPSEDDRGGDLMFAPLWDLGEGYGCTSIEYWEATPAGGHIWQPL